MSLPALTDAGELPPGVHRARLSEVIDRFGIGSPQRKAMALRLARTYQAAQACGHLARFVVFGSFVTDKREPADVDVFLLMEDTFDASTVFWLRRLAAWEGETTTIEHWQVKRDGSLRGIIEVAPEAL